MKHTKRVLIFPNSNTYSHVARALTLLTRTHLETIGTISEIDEKKCVGCGLCADLCPYKAIEIVWKRTVVGEKLVAQVNKALCKGCGVCTASCRSGSVDLKGFTTEEIMAQITELCAS